MKTGPYLDKEAMCNEGKLSQRTPAQTLCSHNPSKKTNQTEEKRDDTQ